MILLKKQIYIFEFKLVDDKGKITSRTAIDQTNEKGYAKQYENDPNEVIKIIKVGVSFSQKDRIIVDRKTE